MGCFSKRLDSFIRWANSFENKNLRIVFAEHKFVFHKFEHEFHFHYNGQSHFIRSRTTVLPSTEYHPRIPLFGHGTRDLAAECLTPGRRCSELRPLSFHRMRFLILWSFKVRRALECVQFAARFLALNNIGNGGELAEWCGWKKFPKNFNKFFLTSARFLPQVLLSDV